MALIKNQAAQRMADDAIVLDLGDLRRQAQSMREQAKAEVARIIEEGRAEAQRLTEGAEQRGQEAGFAAGKAEGYEAGRAEGHAEALKEAKESLARLEQAWVNAATQWDAERRQMVQEARQSLLTLAVRIAEKIVQRVPRVDPTVVQDQVAAALEHVTGPCDVRVAIHPSDRKLVEQALPGVVERLSQVRHASLVEDERVGWGGCVVMHGSGRIDATLETQLDRLVQTLLGEVEATPTGPATVETEAMEGQRDTENAGDSEQVGQGGEEGAGEAGGEGEEGGERS